MSEEGGDRSLGDWTQSAVVDTCVLRRACHYSVPQTVSEDHEGESPVIAVSVEEKVSDLIRSYPHWGAFLKSHSKDANARIRDLEISTEERNHLLYEIIAARRQQLLASRSTGHTSFSAFGARLRPGSYDPGRKRLTRRWPKRASRLEDSAAARREITRAPLGLIQV